LQNHWRLITDSWPSLPLWKGSIIWRRSIDRSNGFVGAPLVAGNVIAARGFPSLRFKGFLKRQGQHGRPYRGSCDNRSSSFAPMKRRPHKTFTPRICAENPPLRKAIQILNWTV
jgi:hypothetical protein